MFKLFLIAISVVFLAGCSTAPRQELQVQQREVIRIGVPAELTEPCKPPAPIQIEAFMKLLPHEREQKLTDYIIVLFGTISECNSKLQQIRRLAPSS